MDAECEVLDDGEKAIRFFENLEQCPDLVILDLNLPKRTGSEVLAQIRQSPACGDVRVLVVTSSNSDRDRGTMSELGISGYFPKPSVYAEFMRLGEVVRGVLFVN